MPREKPKPPSWRTGSRVLPTVQMELDDGVGVKASECGKVKWKSTSKVLPTVVLEPMEASCVPIQLTWVDAVNGRASPVTNGRYVPTARFAGEEEQFSVIVEFGEAGAGKGELRLLNPDLVQVQQRLRPGAALEIMEGPRVVASCVVERL